MKTIAAISTPAGLQVEEIELGELQANDVLLRVSAANVGSADIPLAPPGLDGAGMPPGPPPGGPGMPPDPPPGGPGMPPGPPAGGPSMPPGGTGFDVGGPATPTHLVNGHGGVAVVEAVGSAVDRVRPGQRVIVVSTPNCGSCRYCVRGLPQFCAKLVPFGRAYARTADGTPVHGNSNVGLFAQHTITTEYHCTPVETDLPDDQLALVANPIVTGAGAALITAPITPDSVVAVVGCGPIGLGYVQAARFAGASRIVAVDPLPQRRAAAERFGANDVFDPGAVDPVAEVRKIDDGGGALFAGGADFVFDASGDARGIEQAWAMTGLGGHLVLAGISSDPFARVSFPLAEFAVIAGRTIHPCQQGSALMARDLPWLVQLAERGVFDLAKLAERTYRLEDAAAAMADVSDRSVLGAAIVPKR